MKADVREGGTFKGLPHAPAIDMRIYRSVPANSARERRRVKAVARDVQEGRKLWFDSYQDGVIPVSVVIGKHDKARVALVSSATVHGKRSKLEAGRIIGSLSIQGKKTWRRTAEDGPEENFNMACVIATEIAGKISMCGYAAVDGYIVDGTELTVVGPANYVNDSQGLRPLGPGSYVFRDGRPVPRGIVSRDVVASFGGISVIPNAGSLEELELRRVPFRRAQTAPRVEEAMPQDPFVGGGRDSREDRVLVEV